MESDKHYFVEGLFIIVFTIAAAVFAVWIGSPGHRDDVIYRIHFPDSVSGLALGDPVKFRGVDVGTVKTMSLDRDNPRLVQVDVRLRKETPVMTDTKASLELKGITGVVFIDLNGGDPKRRVLRGGSWKDPAEKLTSSFRRGEPRELKDDAVGLRCVLAVEEKK